MSEGRGPFHVWELLGSPRGEYRQARPWKQAKMTREEYERMILEMPYETLQDFRLANHAERLVRELFR